MQTRSLSLVRLQSSSKDWSEKRERRSGYRRRVEDDTLSRDEGPAPQILAGPSLGFLTQVAAQTLPAPYAQTGVYHTPRWRCGICADTRA